MRAAATRTICSCRELSSRYGTARSSGRSSHSPQAIERATRKKGPNRCARAPSELAVGGAGAGAEDPGVSCSTMVTAHHDAESSDRCLIALQDPEEFLVGAEQERGVACGEHGASTRWVL